MAYQPPNRRRIRQNYIPFALTVGITPTILSQGNQQANLDGLYDSILLSVPQGAANNVILGDASVSAALFNGLEIRAGVPIMLSITNDRVSYELESHMAEALCQPAYEIPFITWDPAGMYFVATAPTVMGVILFPRPYI